jgi:hypothetical protein
MSLTLFYVDNKAEKQTINPILVVQMVLVACVTFCHWLLDKRSNPERYLWESMFPDYHWKFATCPSFHDAFLTCAISSYFLAVPTEHPVYISNSISVFPCVYPSCFKYFILKPVLLV